MVIFYKFVKTSLMRDGGTLYSLKRDREGYVHSHIIIHISHTSLTHCTANYSAMTSLTRRHVYPRSSWLGKNWKQNHTAEKNGHYSLG